MMAEVIIGIDPDVEQHGIALYLDGRLVELRSWQLMDLHGFLAKAKTVHKVTGAIENVMANNFIYAKNLKTNEMKNRSLMRAVGRNQQAQLEVMRVFDHLDLPYVLFKPCKDNWAKKNVPLFQKATGWTKKSNVDTRSAAYFGFLLANKRQTALAL